MTYIYIRTNRDKRKDNITKGVLLMSTYAIDILDKQNKKIGELMTATTTEILQLITKGFLIIDKVTNQEITENMLTATVGVSECIIR